jgi:hypothetical protein
MGMQQLRNAQANLGSQLQYTRASTANQAEAMRQRGALQAVGMTQEQFNAMTDGAVDDQDLWVANQVVQALPWGSYDRELAVELCNRISQQMSVQNQWVQLEQQVQLQAQYDQQNQMQYRYVPQPFNPPAWQQQGHHGHHGHHGRQERREARAAVAGALVGTALGVIFSNNR